MKSNAEFIHSIQNGSPESVHVGQTGEQIFCNTVFVALLVYLSLDPDPQTNLVAGQNNIKDIIKNNYKTEVRE